MIRFIFRRRENTFANGNNPRTRPRTQSNSGTPDRIRDGRFVRSSRTPFQWSDIDASLIGEFVQLVTSHGSAVICGVTSDGGALSITILDGDERIKDWPATVDEFVAIVDWLRVGA